MTDKFHILNLISGTVANTDGSVYLVGGAVRQWIENHSLPDDIDITVFDCDAEAVSKTLADTLDGHFLVLDPEFKAYRVVLKDKVTTIDVTQGLNNDLNDDLARRDLTINAMGIQLTGQIEPNWQPDTIVDPFNGIFDLTEKCIKMVSKDNLLDDPLRLLRVFRCGASINADDYDPKTLEVVAENGEKLLEAAPERIQQEFFKLLSAEPCYPHLRLMADIGLLEVIFPEMSPMHEIPANGYHHLGLFDHTLELVKQSEILIHQFNQDDQAYFRHYFNPQVKRFGLIKFGCLLHDFGKPDTLGHKEGENGERLTFYGHDKVSETLTGAIGKRLKLGNTITKYLQKLVRWHLYPCHFGEESPRKSIMRFLNRIGDEVPDLLLLSLSDRYSTRSEMVSEADIQRATQQHFYLLEQYKIEAATIKAPPLLSGKDIMTLCEITEGPKIGKIMTALKEAQLIGEFSSPEGAKKWVKANKEKILG